LSGLHVRGLDLQDELRQHGSKLPVIFMTEGGTIELAARAMKAGAVDFLLTPFRDQDLLDGVHVALELNRLRFEADGTLALLRDRVASLSSRQRSVCQLLSEGRTTQEICEHLNLHRSSVRVYRHAVRRKLGVRTVRDLIRIGDLVFNPQVEGENHVSQF
jgi:FixJ family two-component response regulator